MPKNHPASVENKPVEKPEPKPAPNLSPFINEGKAAEPLPPHRELPAKLGETPVRAPSVMGRPSVRYPQRKEGDK